MSKHVIANRCESCEQPLQVSDSVIFTGRGIVAHTRHDWNPPAPGQLYIMLEGRGNTAFHLGCWQTDRQALKPWRPVDQQPDHGPIFGRTAQNKYVVISHINRPRIGDTPEQAAAHAASDWHWYVDRYRLTAWMYPPN